MRRWMKQIMVWLVAAGVGFFTTEGKSEILYGICAAACLFCMIVQTAMAV